MFVTRPNPHLGPMDLVNDVYGSTAIDSVPLDPSTRRELELDGVVTLRPRPTFTALSAVRAS